MKIKTIYRCQKCEYQSSKWLGKCPSCNSWNSFIEDQIDKNSRESGVKLQGKVQEVIPLGLKIMPKPRILTGIGEFDRIIGGGIVRGSLTLLSGEPGIGKSTLTLQICDKLAEQLSQILYISGEESTDQISIRAQRLGIQRENVCLLNETKLENIIATISAKKPELVIIDSIQVMQIEGLESGAGSIPQVRTCTEFLMHLAKTTNTPVLLTGHVTKDGNLAGPRVLEHLVDTVLCFEGDRFQQFRILRSLKNRFGSTNEIGVFSMEQNGLNEIKNPSAIFIESRGQNAVGSCVTCAIEGARALLIEIQALTNPTDFGYPRRTVSGFDINRLHLLIGVLQKHAEINLSNQDVYINIAGGFTITEPCADLAVCLAIVSSFKKKPLPINMAAFGEIGLSGEVRKSTMIDKRIKECKNFGFQNILSRKEGINIHLNNILKTI